MESIIIMYNSPFRYARVWNSIIQIGEGPFGLARFGLVRVHCATYLRLDYRLPVLCHDLEGHWVVLEEMVGQSVAYPGAPLSRAGL